MPFVCGGVDGGYNYSNHHGCHITHKKTNHQREDDDDEGTEADATRQMSKSSESFHFEDAHDSSQCHPSDVGHHSATNPDKRAPSPRRDRATRRQEDTSIKPSTRRDSHSTTPRQQTRRTKVSIPDTGCTNCNIVLPSSFSRRDSSTTSSTSPPSSSNTPPSSSASSVSSPSPPLRSRVRVDVCTPQHRSNTASTTPHSSFSTNPTSVASSYSPSSSFKHPHHQQQHPLQKVLIKTSSSSYHSQITQSYHSHSKTYLSTHTPSSPLGYSSLRRAIVRTLSGEYYPRGHTGHLSFTDEVDGAYVIAYTFRLKDPHARGGGRLYSLIALTGGASNDQEGEWGRAYGITSSVWNWFEGMAGWLIELAAREQLQQGLGQAVAGDVADRLEAEDKPHVSIAGRGGGNGAAAPGIGFLTTARGGSSSGRMASSSRTSSHGGVGMVDQKARSLVEITGDERVFAGIHARFVRLYEMVGT